MSTADLQKIVARLEAVTGRLESINVGGKGGSAAVDDDPDWLDYYKVLKKDVVNPFIASSKAIGSDVAKQADLIQSAFDAHDTLLMVAAKFNTPSQKDLQELLKPLSTAISAVQDFREKNRPSKQFNFLSAVSEGIPFLGWVTIAPKPALYIQQMEESAQFYTNKILKEFRQSNPKLADWSNSLIKLLKKFQEYVKENHGTGLVWNRNKPPATASSANSISGAIVVPPLSAGGPPPPPPPALIPPPLSDASSKGDPADKSALLAALSQGANVTKGLKKVSDDMKTHKNPALRSKEPVPPKSDALHPRPFKKVTPPGSKAAATKKPPIFELQNKKWVVEYQDGNQNMVIEEAETNHTVYMYKCTNSVLQVKSKINSITLDGCKKCGIVFGDLISTCEFVNCTSIKAQADGAVPTISIDKTDGAQIYVNKKSMKAQIITAKSSEMNVCITKADGDLVEYPLAEQFKTVWDGKAFTTTPMDLNL